MISDKDVEEILAIKRQLLNLMERVDALRNRNSADEKVDKFDDAYDLLDKADDTLGSFT